MAQTFLLNAMCKKVNYKQIRMLAIDNSEAHCNPNILA